MYTNIDYIDLLVNTCILILITLVSQPVILLFLYSLYLTNPRRLISCCNLRKWPHIYKRIHVPTLRSNSDFLQPYCLSISAFETIIAATVKVILTVNLYGFYCMCLLILLMSLAKRRHTCL